MKSNNFSPEMQAIEEVKILLKTMQKSSLDYDLIEQLTTEMQGVIAAARAPMVVEKRRHFGFVFNFPTVAVLCAVMLLTLVGALLYRAAGPSQQLVDNDLKYRYIKMKGTATAKQIAHLEDLFEQNRNPAAIKEMRSTVAAFEDAVAKRAHLDEQARLHQLESTALEQTTNALRQK